MPPSAANPQLAAFASSSSSSSSAGSDDMLKIPKERHEQLLESEILHFRYAMKPHPMTLQQILAQRDPETLREFLLEELPIRWARRLHLIELMPRWNEFPQMRVIRGLYTDAFRRLRMVPQTDAERFRTTIQSIERRNSNMLEHVVRGIRAMKEKLNLSGEHVDEFLDDFLTGRIGTAILSAQYIAITRPDGPRSVIDPDLDPVAVVREAAREAVRICKHHYDFAPQVDVIDIGQVRFPFIKQYLYYVMFELLKNALRAVAERHGQEGAVQRPVRVSVCGDDATVVIRVSDQGGGIPLHQIPKVWSYLYTTAPVRTEGADDRDSGEDDDGVPPIAGFGCGLPLSRTYATYTGGRLEMNSMPHHGTDVYLYLNRIGNAQEQVDTEPLDARASLPSSLPSRGFLPRVS